MKVGIFNKQIDDKILDELKKEYEIVLTKEIENLTFPLNYHTDIQIAKVLDNTFVCEPSTYTYYCEKLANCDVKILCGNTSLKSNYPDDIAYNIARVGKIYFCNEKHTDKKILELIDGNLININQGYSKCNISIVDDNSIITSDDGIFSACNKNHINALKISKGQIALPPYEYGFIGGSSFNSDEKSITFFGNIKMHNDYNNILDFCKNLNVKITFVGKNMLEDYGSAVIIN